MLLKWIVCDLAASDRAAFAAGQRAWAGLAHCPGFGGQFGGWSADGRACIAGLWADRAAYAGFMAGPHDPIAERADQARYITSSRVALYTRSVAIGRGLRVGGDCLRVAECRVKPVHVARFCRAQREIWSPGMAACAGFVGGLFAEGEDERFIVLTRWADGDAHARYRRDVFPRLQQQARPADDLAGLTGHTITLAPDWRVPRG